MYRLIFKNRETPFVAQENVTVIGRDPGCALRLTDPGISDRHAAIERRADGIYIRDLVNAGSVRVNGHPITDQRLSTRDEIEIGAVQALFEIIHDTAGSRRAFDPWQSLAVVLISLLVAGQLGLFAWIFSQDHPRRARTDIVKGQRQQQIQTAASNAAATALAPLPATESPAPPPSPVMNRMIRIMRVDHTDATLRIQIKAQVGERSLDTGAIGISVQCGGAITWLAVPVDWDNFATRTISAHLCAGAVVRTYYRKILQDEWTSR